MMRITALGYVGFQTPAYEEFATYGPEVFGLGLEEPDVDGTVFLRMDDRHHRIAIHPGDDHRLAYVGWELAGQADFQAALEHLEKHGVGAERGTMDEAASRHVQDLARFEDPAGFTHEVFYGATFTPGSFQPGKPMAGRFVAGEQGVGHVVVFVPGFTDELAGFATEVLGFQLFGGFLQEQDDGTVIGPQFYRCNPRTHCFAYVGAPDVVGAHHLCIEATDLDDVGRAYDLCQERGDVVMTLGRHSLDTLVSFYLRTPGGFDMEYGAGGELLDDAKFVQLNPTNPEVWGHENVKPGFPAAIKPAKPALV